jgi:hypothetical protein
MWPRGCRTGPLLGIDPDLSPPPCPPVPPARQPRVAPHRPGRTARGAGKESRPERCGGGGGGEGGGPPRRGSGPRAAWYIWGSGRHAYPPFQQSPWAPLTPPWPGTLCIPSVLTCPRRFRPAHVLRPARLWPRACWSALFPRAPQQGPRLVLRRPGRPARGASEVSLIERCETEWLSGRETPPWGSGGLPTGGGGLGARGAPPSPPCPPRGCPRPPPLAPYPFYPICPNGERGLGEGKRGCGVGRTGY